MATLGLDVLSLKPEQQCPLLPTTFMEAVFKLYATVIFISFLLVSGVGSCPCLRYLKSYSLPLAHRSFPLPVELLEIHQRFTIFLQASSKLKGALTLKLLTLEGNVFRGLSLVLCYQKFPENTRAGSGETVGGGREGARVQKGRRGS